MDVCSIIFSTLRMFENFHNKVGKNINVLMYCGTKEFGLHSDFGKLINDFKRSY